MTKPLDRVQRRGQKFMVCTIYDLATSEHSVNLCDNSQSIPSEGNTEGHANNISSILFFTKYITAHCEVYSEKRRCRRSTYGKYRFSQFNFEEPVASFLKKNQHLDRGAHTESK